ncbi:MAG: FtsH protease activity modulator HflK [Pseudomonadales bacterium]|nr:FtsH protease activity modulator HflK [Pseudomonadales bacterium]
MAWNEPGNNGKDPWGGGGDQGPPDLDEAFRKFKEKFSGKKSGSGGSNGKGGPDLPEMNMAFFGLGVLALFVIWIGLGVYQVDQQENAVVLRFGKFQETVGAGLHWNPPLIDKVHKVNITKVRSSSHRGLMLTEDDNIVEIALSVQWTVADPKAFLLRVRSPEASLDHATESAMRHAVGSTELHQVLTEGRVAIAIEVQERTQRYLDAYETGIIITTVNIEDAQPPQQVQSAYDDVIRAKEDEQREKNIAETYRNGVIPEARGHAQRQMEEALAYKEQVIARADGDAQRFNKLVTEYKKAPKVTRQRLYLDTMEMVMSNTTKVMIDVDGGNMMYLPLDKLMATQNASTNPAVSAHGSNYSSGSSSSSARTSGRSSTRGTR